MKAYQLSLKYIPKRVNTAATKSHVDEESQMSRTNQPVTDKSTAKTAPYINHLEILFLALLFIFIQITSPT